MESFYIKERLGGSVKPGPRRGQHLRSRVKSLSGSVAAPEPAHSGGPGIGSAHSFPDLRPFLCKNQTCLQSGTSGRTPFIMTTRASSCVPTTNLGQNNVGFIRTAMRPFSVFPPCVSDQSAKVHLLLNSEEPGKACITSPFFPHHIFKVDQTQPKHPFHMGTMVIPKGQPKVFAEVFLPSDLRPSSLSSPSFWGALSPALMVCPQQGGCF